MTITQLRRTRRPHSEAFKQSPIEACREPGASVAGVALANVINTNQLRRWMRERGIEPPALSACCYVRRPPSRWAALSRCSFPLALRLLSAWSCAKVPQW